MVDRYVGPGGNDGNSGLTWALRKLTLNGVEDTPVVAGDDIFVGPGTYRESLTVDVSGGAGTEITYIADVTGCNTDNIGGVVRVTGSDNDQTPTRNYCVTATSKDYRIFRGFRFDLTTLDLMLVSNCDYWTVEDCAFLDSGRRGLSISGTSPTYWVIRRCVFFPADPSANDIHIDRTADGSGYFEIYNCLFLAQGYGACIYIADMDEVEIYNCSFLAGRYGVQASSCPGTSTITVYNCIFAYLYYGVYSNLINMIVEDYNTFFNNSVDHNNVPVGGNRQTYPPLLATPLLFAGASEVSGFRFPWEFGSLSQWSQVGEITGSGPKDNDLVGIVRPPNNASKSWGCLQRHDKDRETTTTRGASAASIKLDDAARWQMWVPVTDTSTTIEVYVYREANYAGNLPQMIIKQPCVADRVTTDVGAVTTWNQLTDTFVPDADTTYVVVELVSRNTAAAGAYDVFFDDLAVS